MSLKPSVVVPTRNTRLGVEEERRCLRDLLGSEHSIITQRFLAGNIVKL